MFNKQAVPTPSPELVLLGVMARVFLSELPKRRRRKFCERVSCIMSELNGGPTVKVVRVVARHADPTISTSRAQAAVWWTLIEEAAQRDT